MVPVYQLDFSRAGPWMSEMQAPDGQSFTVSGDVLDADPPRSVGFTWAWHDGAGARGHESRVRIDLEPVGDSTRFTLTHSDLPDAASRTSHNEGWTSSLSKLEAIF